MINREQGHFMHPDFDPILEQLPQKAENPYDNFGAIRKIINETADQHATHPLVITKELQLSRIDDELRATKVESARISRYGYVGDIHGLTEDDFGKLRETLVAGNFTQVFFLGDIGGSEKLSKLQKLFYQGGPGLDFNQFYNKYRQLMGEESADQNTAIEAVKPGYLNLRSYEIYLESISSLSEEESRIQAEEEIQELPKEELNERILKALTHGHYGHYVSDLSDKAIISLQADVEGYYERFLVMVQEIKSRGVNVAVLQGNWDARLPFDFKRNTKTPVPLSPEKRRFNPKKYFRQRVDYFTNLGTIESRDAIHIMIPFDSVAGNLLDTMGFKQLSNVKSRVDKAKKEGKRVIMLAHAVPAWEKHSDKKPNDEGAVTQLGLQQVATVIEPDDLIYGHEHKARKNKEEIYKLRPTADGMDIGPDETIQEVSSSEKGILVSHLPVPSQLDEAGFASVEQARFGYRAPRGNGGKQSPIRVDRPHMKHMGISDELPTNKTLYPHGRKNKSLV